MVKETTGQTGDAGSIPGSERSPGEENGYPLQYSCLENSMDGGAWWAAVHGVAKSQTQLSNEHFYLNSNNNSRNYSSFGYFILHLLK